MPKENIKEWRLNVPWGKLAMISWGDPALPPVLMVHGYMDTAATFYPLVELLPSTNYYVSFDLPGHGRSDPMPGPPISLLHFVEATRQIVEQMHWNTFNCIAHSMGYIICVLYNAACPRRLQRLVTVSGPHISIGAQGIIEFPEEWFQMTQVSYYLRHYVPAPPVTYSYDEAVNLLSKRRGVSGDQAVELSARCLVATSDGNYKFTWDPRVKKLFPVPLSPDSLLSILSSSPLTLYLKPIDDEIPTPFYDFAENMLSKLDKKKFLVIEVPGKHNAHFSQAERIVPYIVRFFNEDFSAISKL